MEQTRRPLSSSRKNPVPQPNNRKSLQTLLRNECCWPVGDPQNQDFYFCGEQKEAIGRPYCALHMRLGFQTERRQYRPVVPSE
jgi:GcrA cell cycle regulator